MWGAAQYRPARADDLPESSYVNGLVGHAQTYMLSCESRSAADLAGFWGLSVNETEFLSQLPGSDNPELGFVGDPNGMWGGVPPHSYGVHAAPVADLLRDYGLDAEEQGGISWDDLRAEIAAGRPVIVWVIGAMWNGIPHTYQADDGSDVIVAAFEHTMILVGYDSTLVYVVDASTGWTHSYAQGSFLRSWEVLGNMAVTARGPGTADTEEEAATDPPPASAPTETPVPPTPAATSTPILTPNPKIMARLRMNPPFKAFFPQVFSAYENGYENGFCQYDDQGVLHGETCVLGQGWCIPPELAHAAPFLGATWMVAARP